MMSKMSRLRAFLYISAMSLALLLFMKLISTRQHDAYVDLSEFMLKEGLVTTGDMQSIIRQTNLGSRLDAHSKRFKTKAFFVRGQDWQRLSSAGHGRVCLAAHTTLDRLHWIAALSKVWGGPVSLALFAPDVDFHIAVVYLKYLLKCSPEVRDRVSIHVTFPGDERLQESEMLSDLVGGMSCEDPKKVLKLLLMVRRAREEEQGTSLLFYPENLLSNVAVAGCSSEFVLLTDIDAIPVAGLDKDLQAFLLAPRSGCERCAFVVPAFEVSEQVRHLPGDKAELARLVEQRRARSFMQNVSSLHQKPSNLKMWIKIPQGKDLNKAFKVEHYEFGYEPIYVARKDDLLPFDERFVGPGMSRNTQVYEMLVSSHDFYVLDNAFALHRGFRSLGDLGAKPQELRQLPEFRDFAREVVEKYGKDPYDLMSKLEGATGTLKVSYWNAASDI